MSCVFGLFRGSHRLTSRKRSASVTSDCTAPRYPLRDSPYVVIIVRWGARRVFVADANTASSYLLRFSPSPHHVIICHLGRRILYHNLAAACCREQDEKTVIYGLATDSRYAHTRAANGHLTDELQTPNGQATGYHGRATGHGQIRTDHDSG